MDFERDWDSKGTVDHQQALHPEAAALAAKGKAVHPGKMHHADVVRTVAPNPDGTVVLPAGTDINQIEVSGRNLIVHLPDGTDMVILDGAVVMPRLVVGDVEIPSVNLAALLIGEEPQPAAGPPRSSGGNFIGPDGNVGDPHGLGDLLPPTELLFTQPETREILPVPLQDDEEPAVTIITPNQPAGATAATAGVSEASLPARGSEPAGSAAASDSERTTGTIAITATDGLAGVTINGVAIATVGQTVTTPLGVLTITSITPSAIGYSYVLSDNVVGAPPAEVFTVVVTDSDGDQASATLTISIADDAPTAVNDADSVTEDGPLVADGNVLTGSGGSDANATDGVADIQGADGAVVSTTGSFQGSYGTLTLAASGAYSYTLANGNAAVQFLVPGQTLTDSFSYTITDADGDTSTATLTITINGADDGVTITGLNGAPGIEGAEVVLLENDLSDGSSPDAAGLTKTGSFGVNGPDGLSSVTVGGVSVLANGAFVAGQVVTTPVGTLTITGFTATATQGGVPTAGTFTYSFVLTDNSLGHGAAGADSILQSFAVVVTDRNGSAANASVDVRIVDDVPTANNDVDGVAAGAYGPETGNVITGAGTVSGAAGADVRGADGAVVSTTGTFEGAYGTLTLNADGSYVYVRAAGTPGGVSDSFSYTLRDGDGDTSTATLRIDIANSNVMIVSIPKVGEGTIVDESGLVNPMGSNAGSGVDTTDGTITYTAPDGPATVTINGQPVIIGTTIATDKGILTITGLNEGQIDYTYELTTNTTGDDVTDSFVVTVTDVDGDTATDTLTITILDDVPTATNDTDSVREDGPLVADGNVITGSGGSDANGTDGNADVQGADGAQVSAIAFGGTAGTVGAPLAGLYGSLVIQANGSYAYTLDNENGVVQGLDKTETLTETFTYTLTDGDGDARTATITITIQGSDDGVTINGLDGEGAEETVFENDLPGGSSENVAALTQTGGFTLSAPDGVATVTVGGQPIFGAGGFIGGVTIANAYGTLSITGFTPTLGADGDVIGGTVSYSYVLTDNTLLHSGVNDGSLTDSFAVVVTDTDGSTDSASLDIRVVDDVPTAVNDVAGQLTENAAVTIDVFANDVAGADGVNLASGVALESGAAKGTVVYQGNGVFLYTPNAGAEGSDSFTYTITDGDGDKSTATVTINLLQDSTPTVSVTDMTVSEAGLPGGTQQAGNSETATGSMTIATGGDTLTKVEVQDKNGAWVDVTGATASTPVVVAGAAGALTVTSDGAGHYSYSYTLAVNDPAHPDNVTSDGDGISGAADPKAGDAFAVRVTDSDGDVSPADTINVTVLDDAPIATADSGSVSEGGSLIVAAADGVLDNDQPGADGYAPGVVGVAKGSDPSSPVSGQVGTAVAGDYGTLTLFADGSYRYDATPNAISADQQDVFVYTIRDADGDLATTTLTIDVANVALAPDNQTKTVFEAALDTGITGSDIAAGSVTGSAPGQPTETATGQLNVAGAVSYTLTSSATGSHGQLQLNANGSYTYTLTSPVDGPTANDGPLTFAGAEVFTYQAVDGSGNIANGTITIDVVDDVPTAVNDALLTVAEDGADIGGNVLTNDTPGADGATLTSVTIGGVTTAINAVGTTNVSGAFGAYTFTAAGAWTFNPSTNLNNASGVSAGFSYVITDGDGDQSTAVQPITVTDGANPIAGAPISLALDDQNLAGGTTQGNPDFVQDNVSFTAGSDALTGFAFATDLSALGGGLTWNRVSATLIEGWDGPVGTGVKIVALTLTAPASIGAGLSGNVQVTATLLDNYDSHPNIALDDSVSLGSVGVVASDQDGDSATATVNLSVSDDVPQAVNDGQLAIVDDNASGVVVGTVAGLLGNDVFGADGPGSPAIAIGTGNLGGTISIVGGNLVYTSHHNIAAPYASIGETFTYTIKDGDGDTSSATFSVLLTDTGPSISAAAAAFTVDEDGLANGVTQPVTGDVDGADIVKTGTLAGLNFGNDGAGNIVLGAVADTGLRTLSNHVIQTIWDGTSHTLTGKDAVTGDNIFTLQITDVASGAYRFELLAPVKHSDPASEDDKSFTVAVTVTDAENESASGTISVTIDDDSPAVTATLPAAGSLVVDESNLAFDATASFAGNFTALYGADGKGSLSYSLGVSAQGAATNLFDTATGNRVYLFVESGKVVGREGTSSGNAAGGPVVFQLTVDALGAVTLDQQRAVLHTPDTGPNQAIGLDVGSLITLTATAVDGDADTVSQQINFGQTISFLDDVGTLGAFSNITVVNGANVVGNGTFSYNAGADGHGSFAITGPVLPGISYTTTQNATGALLTATTDPDGPGGNPPVTVFTLQVNANGTSVFTLVTPQAATSETISLLGLSAGGPTPFVQTADGRVEFTGNGNGVNSSTQGFGVDNQFVGNGENFTIEFHNPGQAGDQAATVNPDMVSSIILKNDNINGSLGIKVTVYNDVTGQSEVVYTNFNVTGTSTLIDPVMSEFNRVSIEGVGGSGQGVRFTSLVINKTILPSDIDLHFTVQATDKDGDVTSTSTLNVFVDATSPTPPVAIDLNGDGLHFVGLDAGVTHDYGNGAVATAWVSSEDGLLGHVTGKGIDIVFTDDAPGAQTDLEGLRLAYDSNGDGKLDTADTAFAEFGVWQDANGNGAVDQGEFKSLTDLGIASIDLNSDGKTYSAANGDVTVLGEASFTRTDGTKGTVGDVIFATGSSDASKTTESTASGFNQALVAASLVAVAGAAEAPAEQQPAPTATESAAPVTETAPAVTVEAEPAATQESAPTTLAANDDQATHEQPAPTGHAAEEAAPDHATLSDGDAHVSTVETADAPQPDLSGHQGLLAQSIDLPPAFDGNAAAVLAAQQAAPAANAADVVKEALGAHDAPNIDALLAALPGGEHASTPILLNPVAGEAVDSGHLAAATAIFEAAMVAHEAMAVAHG
ncbi:hypothetical protein Sj15T_15120 [Sphingobium sp. TA15]|uniref:Hemolysin-type calcium-binding repeat protein VCBS n=1 Tax=Sphingobium indicum (strain DSM 16413 / CCM 7287 / MTCC 6362 / UT26 / NBRC 101211 / UT26S) TaxID=452662 RepID=D4Z385_SPHIU|nr:Ig-like domain-containing protein [Sphingobium indicum]BAI97067.1 hemolysin-type calcium-binding repeat protein VCBS [Sphingobium indicum UT26S]BDD66491.1 hypothetical protein Sj15T_15120 [Sphingobium sp. TA15]